MEDYPSRRGVLTGLAFAAANLLFCREIAAADYFSAAQGVPAGLLRLDSPTPSLNAQANLVDEVQQPKARTHVRKHHIAQ